MESYKEEQETEYAELDLYDDKESAEGGQEDESSVSDLYNETEAFEQDHDDDSGKKLYPPMVFFPHPIAALLPPVWGCFWPGFMLGFPVMMFPPFLIQQRKNIQDRS